MCFLSAANGGNVDSEEKWDPQRVKDYEKLLRALQEVVEYQELGEAFYCFNHRARVRYYAFVKFAGIQCLLLNLSFGEELAHARSNYENGSASVAELRG